MIKSDNLRAILLASTCSIAWVSPAFAGSFDIPGGDLKSALKAYSAQSGVPVVVSDATIKGAHTKGIKGELPPDEALSRILRGTGFTTSRDPSGVIAIVPGGQSSDASDIQLQPMHLAQAAPARAAVETVTVTSSKLGGGDVQSIPIAITALSQEQLTATQTAGGPDLVKQVPNLTFSKTNFTGYNIQIRGIGTQAISVTTDPAVAVAFNDTPFIRNHFFEQEFYDLSQAEVLRGPQGTLYGRNATAGVVNITSAKPTDQFEAVASADIGNYKNRRLEGMINLPIVGDKFDLRVAGEWTKRDGYTFNETTGQQIDGRDLWSGRLTLAWKPISTVQSYFIWEHFQEDDDRLRTSKQLCKTDPGPSTLTAADGTVVQVPPAIGTDYGYNASYFSQGCLPASLYSKDSFQVPNGFALPFVAGAAQLGFINNSIDPYAEVTQSTNLRDIQSAIEPKYLAKNDTLELNTSWNIAPTLTFYSDTGYNRDFLWSSEDYNRFDTSPGIFLYPNGRPNVTMTPDPAHPGAGIFCDAQLGCSDRLVVQDLSSEHSWQLSQEIRLASNFQGPLNFSLGGNYLHYETEENYYVLSNTFTMVSLSNVICSTRPYIPGVTDNQFCLQNGRQYNTSFLDPHSDASIPTESPQYIDPNPITSLDANGHNYFLSQNPYVLNSYAGFGEVYYNVTSDLKLTGGLRWTDDQKHFTEIPSELFTIGYGYPSIGAVDQSWQQWTGRFVANWSPKLSFTDQSMLFASYSHGYKAGGANPPGAVLIDTSFAPPSGISNNHINFPVHPQTFKPEFIDAYEAGTKNTLLDGALTLNGDVFFYNYRGYQISQIVDRTSVNLNFDATVKGAEVEATWEPVPGLKFSFAGGYEDTNINNNQYAIDLIDRTAGMPGWLLVRPNVGQASNCIIPVYVAAAILQKQAQTGGSSGGVQACGDAYSAALDPVTRYPYTLDPTVAAGGDVPSAYPGFDPLSVDPTAPANVNNGLGLPPNNGEGFAKNVGGNELPGAPHFTASFSTDYTFPVTPDWAATIHSDFYWQAESWARVFNDNPYDRIHGYKNVNLALILTDTSGWQVMGYVKNVFDTTAITGDFLNSDDSGLTTNVFLTDPRLFGVRVTKHFDGGSSSNGEFNILEPGGKRPQVWLQIGGNFDLLSVGSQSFEPPFSPLFASDLPTPADTRKAPHLGFDWEGKAVIQPPDSDWKLTAGIRYGRTSKNGVVHKSLPTPTRGGISAFGFYFPCTSFGSIAALCSKAAAHEFVDAHSSEGEQHQMIDFTIGKDVGLGAFEASSTIAAGVRAVQFTSLANSDFNGDPFVNFTPQKYETYHDVYEAKDQERRTFHGIGPELTWDASVTMFGNNDDGQVTFDWGLNAAVLFGRQKATIHHQSSHCHAALDGLLANCSAYVVPVVNSQTFERTRNVVVPNLGGYLGLSVRYTDAKASFGYRADTFFGAMDGGQETAKSYTRGFYGPYLNVSLGL